MPLKSAADYDAWLERHRTGENAKGRKNITGAQLRRMVVARCAGVEWRDCASMMGIELSSARRWYGLLPDELKG